MEDGRAFSHVNIRGDGAKKCTKDEEDSAKDGSRGSKRWDCRGKDEDSCCQRKDDVGYSFHGVIWEARMDKRCGRSEPLWPGYAEGFDHSCDFIANAAVNLKEEEEINDCSDCHRNQGENNVV